MAHSNIQDVAGEVHASCVNGRLQAHNLEGRTELNTVNGQLGRDHEQVCLRRRWNSQR